MATVNTGFGYHHPSTSTTVATFVLNGSTDQMEFICQAPAGGSITVTRLGYRLTAITGTTPTYRISLQGVSAGVPDGTIKGGASPASATFSPSGLGQTANNWYWITLANSYATTSGELLAVVIDYSSGTIDASNNATFTSDYVWANQFGIPYAIQNDAGTRTRRANLPVFGFGTADTAYGHPLKSIAQVIFNSGSTPDEYANKIIVPSGLCTSFQISGADILAALTGGHTMNMTLYDSDGSTVLQQVGLDTNAFSNTSLSDRLGNFNFDEATLSTLVANHTYYLSFAPQDTTNQRLWVLTVDAAGDMSAWGALGTGMYLSTKTDGGAFSDTTTQRLYCNPRIVDLTASGGASAMQYRNLMRGNVG